jgi:hypothetical protein
MQQCQVALLESSNPTPPLVILWKLVKQLPEEPWRSIIKWVSFSFLGLGFELRASQLQSRCSTTWATPPAHQVSFYSTFFNKPAGVSPWTWALCQLLRLQRQVRPGGSAGTALEQEAEGVTVEGSLAKHFRAQLLSPSPPGQVILLLCAWFLYL